MRKFFSQWSVATLAAVLLLVMVVPSCCGPGELIKQPDAAFVGMSRAMHDTIATEYLTYISHDGELSSLQKLNRADAVADWEFAIRQAEALLAAGIVQPSVPAPSAPVEPEPEPVEGGGGDE